MMDEFGGDEAARRAYWTASMDEAFEFMERVAAYPVQECWERVAPLPQAAEEAGVELAFAADKLAGRYERVFCLRRGLVGPLMEAARELNERGLVLRVEDAYRTAEAQRALGLSRQVFDAVLRQTRWELGGNIPSPELLRRRLAALVAASPKIGTHMSASAVDVSILDRDTGEELDRGGPYIGLSERTPMGSPFVSEHALANRRLVSEAMERRNFVAYPYEFWHYSSGDAYEELAKRSGRPARYGPVEADLRTGRVEPVFDPSAPLHSPLDIHKALAEAVERVWGE